MWLSCYLLVLRRAVCRLPALFFFLSRTRSRAKNQVSSCAFIFSPKWPRRVSCRGVITFVRPRHTRALRVPKGVPLSWDARLRVRGRRRCPWCATPALSSVRRCPLHKHDEGPCARMCALARATWCPAAVLLSRDCRGRAPALLCVWRSFASQSEVVARCAAPASRASAATHRAREAAVRLIPRNVAVGMRTSCAGAPHSGAVSGNERRQFPVRSSHALKQYCVWHFYAVQRKPQCLLCSFHFLSRISLRGTSKILRLGKDIFLSFNISLCVSRYAFA